MKKIVALMVLFLLIVSTNFLSVATNHVDQNTQFSNYNNDLSYFEGISQYSIAFNYVKNKGYNVSASMEIHNGLTEDEVKSKYINDLYPDATLWLWNYESNLWIPIPLELRIIYDDLDKPHKIEFYATWSENMMSERVTHGDINSAIADALVSNNLLHQNNSASCWLELAVGKWVEYNDLFPVGSNRTQGEMPSPPFEELYSSLSDYSNIEDYEIQKSKYLIEIQSIKNKGYNISASFKADLDSSVEEIEMLYANDLYPDATLWLWDFSVNLWIPIPLELDIILDEIGNPYIIEFNANWKDNLEIDRVTQLDINTAVQNALQSNFIQSGNNWSNCWLELAVGNWVEFNVLYPE